MEALIHVIRGQKVMLDADLAALYEVATKSLNLSVRRNAERFPKDFMFQLTLKEAESLRLQTETSNAGAARGGRRYLPYAFSEPGIAMLSSVLRSERAIQMNILIIRAFIRMRELLASNKEIAGRVEKLERNQDKAVSAIEVPANDIDRLDHEVKRMKTAPPVKKRNIGFLRDADW